MKLHIVWTYTDKEIKDYGIKILRHELKRVSAITKYEKRLKAEIKKRGKR